MFNRGGGKLDSLSTETNLVIDNLFVRTTLVEHSVELDDVCVLAFSYVSLVATEADIMRWQTVASYWFAVPSKQRTITLGLGVVESDDMAEGCKPRGLRREAATPRGHHKGKE